MDIKKKHICTGLLAHVDAGKTTLSESMLYTFGAIRTMGRVDHQDTFLDTDGMERERGITIFSKQAELTYGDLDLMLLDTPGHVDFSAEMERTLWVLDYAILVINGCDGVQSHTKTLWKLLERAGVPCFLFINKMDIAQRGPEELMKELRENLSQDLMDMTEEIRPISSEEEGWFDLPEEWWENLAMCDEGLMEEYLEQGKIAPDTFRKAVAGRKVFPCIFGSALKSQGVTELLELLEFAVTEKKYPPSFGARVFKIGRDTMGNRLTYLKVTGGCLRVKDEVTYNGGTAKNGSDQPGEAPGDNCRIREKINQIRRYSGEKYTVREEIPAGELCAVTGLTATLPGMALGDEKEHHVPVMESVLSYRVFPPKDVSPQVLLGYMRQLEEEDPQLRVTWSEELQEIHVNLMGQIQTQVLQSLIKNRFGVLVTFGSGSILYKETIANPVEGVGHFEPLRHYAEAHVLLEPLPLGSGLEFAMDCPTDVLDLNWQRLIYTHLTEREHPGVLTGSPITDMRLTVVTGRAHPKHTEGGDFRQATYRAIRQGLKKAQGVLLEPCYQVRLEIPAECVGRAMTDLTRMEGEVAAPLLSQDTAVLTARVPVACLGDYSVTLASYTGGKGRMNLELAGYFPCHNTEEVIEQIGYDSEEDVAHPTASVFCAHGAGYPVPWYEVEEHMHVPLTGKSDGSFRERPEEISQEEMIAQAKARAQAMRRGTERAYDGYGGLESDLEEIFVREFGQIRRRLPQQEKKVYGKPEKEYVPKKKKAPRKKYFLVDGYNVIFTWEDLADLARDNLEAARGKLADILCNFCGYIGGELILVFDAYKVKENPGEVQKYHNIYVVYTREAETADAYIERTTHEIAKDCDVTVATSDALEQMIVIGAGAKRISSRELAEEIRRVEQEALERYRNGQKGGLQ